MSYNYIPQSPFMTEALYSESSATLEVCTTEAVWIKIYYLIITNIINFIYHMVKKHYIII